MSDATPPDEPHHNDPLPRDFSFVLIPGFSLLALSSAIDVLRAANVDVGTDIYRWRLLAHRAGPIDSSSGLQLPCESFETCAVDGFDKRSVIAIVGGDGSHNFHDEALSQWLRQFSISDSIVGSISDGAFVAADCGLFYNHRSTIHWKCLEAYKARFPELDCRASILEFDRRRFSCAGGTASLDLFLHFVHEDFGAEGVAKINDNYFHDTVRDSSISQHMAQAYRFASHSKLLAEAMRLMTQHVEQPLPIAVIADRVGTTHRSLDRLYKKHLGMSPGKYFRKLRLARAGGLLLQTGLPISEIAFSCGFNTASHLGTHFRHTYGLTPNQYRKRSVASAPLEYNDA